MGTSRTNVTGVWIGCLSVHFGVVRVIFIIPNCTIYKNWKNGTIYEHDQLLKIFFAVLENGNWLCSVSSFMPLILVPLHWKYKSPFGFVNLWVFVLKCVLLSSFREYWLPMEQRKLVLMWHMGYSLIGHGNALNMTMEVLHALLGCLF